MVEQRRQLVGAIVCAAACWLLAACGGRTNEAVFHLDHRGAVTVVLGLADGRVASGDTDGVIHLWDPDDADAEPVVLAGHRAPVDRLIELADGALVSADRSGAVHVRGSDDRTPWIFDRHDDALTALVALADGRVASADASGAAFVWTPGTGDARAIEGHTGPVRTILAVGDGRIAWFGDAGPILVGRPGAPPTHRLDGHPDGVVDADRLPDGRLVSAGRGGRVIVRDLDRPLQEKTIDRVGPNRIVDLDPLSDDRVAVLTADGRVRLLPTGDETVRPVDLVEPTGARGLGASVLADGRLVVWYEGTVDGPIGPAPAIWARFHNPDRPEAIAPTVTFGFGVDPSFAALGDGRLISVLDQGIAIWTLDRPVPGVIVLCDTDGPVAADAEVWGADFCG